MKKLKKVVSLFLLYSFLFHTVFVNALFLTPWSIVKVSDTPTIDWVYLTWENTGASIQGNGNISNSGWITMEWSGLYLNIYSWSNLIVEWSWISMSGTNNSINILWEITNRSILKLNWITSKIDTLNIRNGSAFFHNTQIWNWNFRKLLLNGSNFIYSWTWSYTHLWNIETSSWTYNYFVLNKSTLLQIDGAITNNSWSYLNIILGGWDSSESSIYSWIRGASFSYSWNTYSIENFQTQLYENYSENIISSWTIISTWSLKLALTGSIHWFNEDEYFINFCKINSTDNTCIANSSFSSTWIYSWQENLFVNLPTTYTGKIRLEQTWISHKIENGTKVIIPLSPWNTSIDFMINPSWWVGWSTTNIQSSYFTILPRLDNKDKHMYLTGESINIFYSWTSSWDTLKLYLSGITNPSVEVLGFSWQVTSSTGTLTFSENTIDLWKYLIKMQKIWINGRESEKIWYQTSPYDYEKDTSLEFVSPKEIYTISGKITYSWALLTSLNNGILFLDWPWWPREVQIQNGAFSFTWWLNERYYLKLNNPITYRSWWVILATNYMSENQSYTVDITWNKSININVKDKTSWVDFLTLSGTIHGLYGKNVIFFGNNSANSYEEKLWILNSNTYIFSIQTPKKLWLTRIWIKKPAWDTGIWIEPKPIEINIWENNIGWIEFTPETNVKNLSVIVKDTNGNTLSWAYVKVYSPSWENIWISKETNNVWIASFMLSKWDYIYVANFKWLQGSIQKTITIGENTSYSAEIILNKPAIEVSGTVYQWGWVVKNVSMYAYNIDNKKLLNTQTDNLWEYKFFLWEWNWNIWWTHQEYGKLTEIALQNLTWSLYNQSFVFEDLSILTWSIQLTWGIWVAWVNIQAVSWSGNYYTFTDGDGNYTLKLKSWDYILKAFSSLYGNIWQANVVISSWNNTPKNFTINTLKNIQVSFIWAWISNQMDISKFNWIFDIYDRTDKVWFSKNIVWYTGYTFENIPSNHTYDLKINVFWIWNMYNTWLLLDNNKTIQIVIPEQEKILMLTWMVYESGTTIPLKDALIDFRNIVNKQVSWVKTDENGIYTIKTALWTQYEMIWKKIWYENSNVFTWTISWTTVFPKMYLEKIVSTVNITGNITNTWGENLKVFISLKWINSQWTENSKWYWKELTLSWTSFTLDGVPQNFWSWKLIIWWEWYALYKDMVRNYTNTIVNVGNISLTPIQTFQPKVMPIISSFGWVFEGGDIWMKIILPSNSLWNTLDNLSLLVKETTLIPNVSWSEPMNGKAKEILTTDENGNLITDLSSDAWIELSYSWSDFVNSKTGIILQEVKNLQISYYDPSTMSWIALPTILTSSSRTLFENYSWSALLSSVSWYQNITFTLKATTNHFTLFTALVSSAVSNSSITTSSTSSSSSSSWWWSVSIISWILETKSKLTTYLWNTNQSIKMIVWTSIDNVLYLERNGKQVFLKDILTDASNNISNISNNLVTFWVGDIISTTKDGSLTISIDGYTRFDMSANAKIKISEVWNNFLTYENILWKNQYDFTHRNDKEFTYKIKWKTSYATIRGTKLDIESDQNKDTYHLIEWKIDVYNDTLKKTVSLLPWDNYIVYVNGNEDVSGIHSLLSSSSTWSLSSDTQTTTERENKNIKITTDTQNQEKSTFNTDLVWTKNTQWNTIKFVYNDVSEKDWYFKYVNGLNSKWIIANNKKFYPNNNITRIELLKMVSLASGNNGKYDKKYTFLDVYDESFWWTKYVCEAKKNNYISSSNDYFKPMSDITRAEALKMILNYKKLSVSYNAKIQFKDVKPNDWWTKYITTAGEKWFISTKNDYFYPKQLITRAEVVKMIYNVFY